MKKRKIYKLFIALCFVGCKTVEVSTEQYSDSDYAVKKAIKINNQLYVIDLERSDSVFRIFSPFDGEKKAGDVKLNKHDRVNVKLLRPSEVKKTDWWYSPFAPLKTRIVYYGEPINKYLYRNTIRYPYFFEFRYCEDLNGPYLRMAKNTSTEIVSVNQETIPEAFTSTGTYENPEDTIIYESIVNYGITPIKYPEADYVIKKITKLKKKLYIIDLERSDTVYRIFSRYNGKKKSEDIKLYKNDSVRVELIEPSDFERQTIWDFMMPLDVWMEYYGVHISKYLLRIPYDFEVRYCDDLNGRYLRYKKD